MKACVLFSGGKDSTFALYWALNQGHEVETLLSFKPARDDSFMFHVPCIDLTKLQAKAIGIGYVDAVVSGEAEKEVEEMAEVLSKLKPGAVVSGALASEYQKSRIGGVCEKMGVESLTPLWHEDPSKLLADITGAGFEVIISAVAADGLDESWLGRRIDEECIRDLVKLNKSHRIHVAGEGGEYETLVIDGPIFREKLEVKTKKEWDGVRGKIVVESAKLVEKN